MTTESKGQWKHPKMVKIPSRAKRVLIFSDVHFPNHCPKAVRTLLEFAEDYKPDQVVINGDLMDFSGISRHADADTANRILKDCEVGNNFLDALRSTVGRGCVIDANCGNHDLRIASFVAKNAPQLTGVTSVEQLLKLKERKIDWMPYSGDNVRFIAPKLGVTHGSFFGTNYTRETLLKYNVSCIVGHSHRPQYTSIPTVGPTGSQVRGCWGLGCLVPVQHVPYLVTPSGWQQGWGVALISPNGNFNVSHVNLTKGKITWHNGKTYG